MTQDDFPSPVLWFNRFFPADELKYDPADQKANFMLRLTAYDITNPKRLRKVAKLCELYGVRVEKSVFESDLSDDLFETFWIELMDIIDPDEDSVISYPLCNACIKNIQSMGVADRPQKRICFWAGI